MLSKAELFDIMQAIKKEKAFYSTKGIKRGPSEGEKMIWVNY